MTYTSTNLWAWIKSLPSINKWDDDKLSLSLTTSSTTPLYLSVLKKLQNRKVELSFGILTELHLPISLWNSTSFHTENYKTHEDFLEALTLHLFYNLMTGVLRYGPKKCSSRYPKIEANDDFPLAFNLSFTTLLLLVCVYEAPQGIKHQMVPALRAELTGAESKQGFELLARAVGSNIEEQWVKSLNLGITNWVCEMEQSGAHSTIGPSSLLCYGLSASRLWKVQVYCPLVGMKMEEPSSVTHDDRLAFSLEYQQVEVVVQLGYKLVFRENWIDVTVNVDNIRCDIVPLVSENMMIKRGYGPEEKHFPSRITLQLTPSPQTDVLSVSVSKSTENPIHEVGVEKGLETSFAPPSSISLGVSASETITTSMKPWKFEQSVYADSAILNWFLHDGVNGREVFSLKLSKCAFFRPRAWFRNRYSSAYRPFTKQGGIIFARDEYGENVCWKLSQGAAGKTMEWEIKGTIWLTYWPNKKRTFHCETRMLVFKEILYLPIGSNM